MNKDLEQLHADYRHILHRLVDFFDDSANAVHGFKINEFLVFSAFLATFFYLRKNDANKAEKILEDFHKSIIVVIVDRIVEEANEHFDQERIDALTETIKKVLMERYSEYFREAAAGHQGESVLSSLSLLVDSFLNHGLAQPLDGHDPARANLSACLEECLASCAEG